MSSDHYVTLIRRAMARHDIRTFQFTRRRKHRAVRVLYGGKTFVITFPSTGSDPRRGPLNAAAFLRRRLGLAGRAT
jgi:hypothetical protein